MIINVYTSLSATKKQSSNAKVLFGSKGQSILSSLEAAAKVKVLDTPTVDALLQWLKASDVAAVEKFASSASGKKLSQACAAFAKNKTFEGKLNALKAIKFKDQAAKKPVSDKNSTELVRGPMKVELDLAIAVGSKGQINLLDSDTKEVFMSLKALKLGLHVLDAGRTTSGIPVVEIYGTRKAITTWLEQNYFQGLDKEDISKLLSDIRRA